MLIGMNEKLEDSFICLLQQKVQLVCYMMLYLACFGQPDDFLHFWAIVVEVTGR